MGSARQKIKYDYRLERKSSVRAVNYPILDLAQAAKVRFDEAAP
jgi:hypothetical protein